MDEQQHTPGPWRVVKDSSGRYLILADQGPLIAQPAIVFGVANARLIAAAPDMLKALQVIAQLQYEKCEHVNAETLFIVLDNKKVSIARAAIAKATGESTNV